MERVSSPASTAPSLTRIAWTFQCWCSAIPSIARPNKYRWMNFSTRAFMPEPAHARYKEAVGDANHKAIVTCFASERADESAAAAYAGAISAAACNKFHRSESWIFRGTGAAGGAALPGVRQAAMHERLSGRGQGKGLRTVNRSRRLPWRSCENPRRQRAARHHWPCLPAGRSLRRWLLDGQESAAVGHWISGAFRR